MEPGAQPRVNGARQAEAEARLESGGPIGVTTMEPGQLLHSVFVPVVRLTVNGARQSASGPDAHKGSPIPDGNAKVAPLDDNSNCHPPKLHTFGGPENIQKSIGFGGKLKTIVPLRLAHWVQPTPLVIPLTTILYWVATPLGQPLHPQLLEDMVIGPLSVVLGELFGFPPKSNHWSVVVLFTAFFARGRSAHPLPFDLLVVWASQTFLDRRLNVRRMMAGKHLEPHVSQTCRAITQPGFLAQVPTRPTWRGWREGPKCLGQQLVPKSTDLADFHIHSLIPDVHPRMRAVGDVGFAFEIASGMAGWKRHGEVIFGFGLLDWRSSVSDEMLGFTRSGTWRK